MRIILLFVLMLFIGFLAGNDAKSEAQDTKTPTYSYGPNGNLFIEQPPIIEEVRVRVVEKIPVIQKVIKVIRPEIQKIYVPVKVLERVPGEPIEAPEQGRAGGLEKGPKKEDAGQPAAKPGDGQLLQNVK